MQDPLVASHDAGASRKPNLFIVGAMKSGTTFFTQLLGSHSQIFISSPKEPCYFGDPERLRSVWPYAWQQGFWRSESAYLQLFSGAGDAVWVGEASTSYSASPIIPDVASCIHQFAPDARILYIMRDPIERTISHYWHMVNHLNEYRRPLEAIRDDPYYMAVSYYARQLAPYLRHFGAQRVYTLTFEQLVANPVETVQSVYAWLGVDAAFAPPDVDIPINVTPKTAVQRRAWIMKLTQTALWRRIRSYRPEALRKYLAGLASRTVHPRKTSMDKVIQYLRPIQRAQTQELRLLLNRDFPEWTTLGLAPAAPKLAAGGLRAHVVSRPG
jgi:hypothetical protein